MSVLEVKAPVGDLYVSIINNPIDARDVSNFRIPMEGTRPLIDVVGKPYDDVIFSINGLVLGAEQHATATVKAGDYVVVVPVLRGGDKKSILRIAALVALTYASAGVASGGIGALGIAGGTGSAFAASAMISVGGGLLVNAVLPVKPVIPKASEPFEDSPSYVANSTNATDQSSPVPIAYGTSLVKPVRVGFRTENIDQKKQQIFMLFALSEGEIEGIEPDLLPPTYPVDEDSETASTPSSSVTADPGNAYQIYIDDQPLRNFYSSEVYVSHTKGDIEQSGPEFFSEESEAQIARAVGLDIGVWQTFTTTKPVDRISVEIANNQGLMATVVYDGGDHQFDVRVEYDIEYKKPTDSWDGPNVKRVWDERSIAVPDHSWQAFYPNNVVLPEIKAGDRISVVRAVNARPNTETVYFNSIAEMLAAGLLSGTIESQAGQVGNPTRFVWKQVGSVKQGATVIRQLPFIVDKSSNPVRRSFQSDLLESSIYDVRLRKRGASSPGMNDIWRRRQVGFQSVDTLGGAPEGYFYLPTPAKRYPDLADYPINAADLKGETFYRSRPAGHANSLNILRDVRVLSMQHGATWVGSSEVLVTPFNYPRTALLSVRMLMSERLSSVPTISVVLRARKVKVFVRDDLTGSYSYYTALSANPAWVLWDMLTSPQLGRISESRLDLDKWYAWAQFCEEKGFQFNGVFQSISNLWDAAQYVLRAGHAQLVNQGTRFSLAIERQDDPVMMFNVGNIVAQSLQVNYLPRDERVNEVEVTYYDRDDNFKESTIVVRDPGAPFGSRQRVHRLDGYWITNSDQATREANFELNQNTLITHTISFEAPVEAIACTVGDQILLQHDMPKWGSGGRLSVGSTATTLKLDRKISMVSGRAYKALLQFDAVSQYGGAIAQRPGNATTTYTGSVVWLSNFDGLKPVKRFLYAGMEFGVSEVVKSDQLYGVRLAAPLLVSVGGTYELKDTDTIVERAVTFMEGDFEEVQIQPALPAAPASLTKWMFGEVSKVKRPYRIKSITGTSDVRSITAVQYDPAVYDLDNVVIEAPVVPSAGISHVRKLSYEHRKTLIGAVYRPEVYLTWEAPVDGVYGGADVYAALNSVDYQLVSQTRSGLRSFTYSQGGSAGDRVKFKVVAVDIFGVSAPTMYAPVIDVEIAPDTEAPEAPTDIEAIGQISAIGLSWTKASAADLKATRIYRGTSSVFADAIVIADVDSEAYVDYPTTESTYHYFLTSVDFAGNESEPASSVSAATRRVQSGDIDSGAITSQAFASNIAPVGIVDVLPNPVGYAGPRVVFLTTEQKLYRYTGTEWTAAVEATDLVGELVASQIADAAITADKLAAEIIDATKFVSDIRPVELVDDLPQTNLTQGRLVFLKSDSKLYRYDGTKWTSAIPAADLDGQLIASQIADGAITAAKIAAEAISATSLASSIRAIEVFDELPLTGNSEGRTAYLKSEGKLYRWDGVKWTASVPTVDLSGQISSGQIADSAVSAGKIADNAITAAKIADSVITATKFASDVKPVETVAVLPTTGLVSGRVVFLTSDGKLYRYTGTKWTSEVPTGDLTGTISSVQISDGAITAAKIADSAITATKFASSIKPVETVAVLPTTGLVSGRVVFLESDGKLYRYTGTKWSAEVQTVDLTGTIATAQIADSAITAVKIANSVITATKFASTVKPIEIVSALPTTSLVAGRVVFLTSDGKLYRYTGTKWTSEVLTSDLTGTVSSDQIANLAINASKISDNAISVSKIVDGAIAASKIAANAIDASKIIDGAITAAKLADAAINSPTKFASGLTPVEIVSTLPVIGNFAGRQAFLTEDGKLYRYTGGQWTKVVEAVDIDSRGLDIRSSSGDTVFSSTGAISDVAYLNINGTPVALSTIAGNALTPSLDFVGEFASEPSEMQLGVKYKQNAVYKNTIDGRSYVLTGTPLGWVIYLESGTSFILSVESSNGTTFRPGRNQQTILKARLFKNGAEVTEQTPIGWFRWRRVSGIPQEPPKDDATWNSLYLAGYRQVSIDVDDVYARATFFCDIISP